MLSSDELLEHTHHTMHHFSLKLLLMSYKGFQHETLLLLHLFNQDLGKVKVLEAPKVTRGIMGSIRCKGNALNR